MLSFIIECSNGIRQEFKLAQITEVLSPQMTHLSLKRVDRRFRLRRFSSLGGTYDYDFIRLGFDFR